MASMFVAPEAAWLFTRGRESVRITRAVATDGACHLRVEGPGEAGEHRAFEDVMTCASEQHRIERSLMTQGFQLETFTVERRDGKERRSAFRGDRRRSRANA